MNDAFTFEPAAWELLVNSLKPGSSLSAMRLLTVTEKEDEETLEEVFDALLAQGVALDFSDLPENFGSGELETRLRMEHALTGSRDVLSQLSEDDPLRIFLEELASIPVQGDPALLADSLSDEAAAQKLAEVMMYRAVDAAFSFTGRGVLLLDLIQEASLGLWLAVSSYEDGDIEAHADRYITHALSCICLRQARENDTVRAMSNAMDAYRRADRKLLDRLGRNATLEEIALEMGVTPEQAELARDMLDSAREMEALKKPAQVEEEEDQAVEDTAYFQSRQRVDELMSGLEAGEAQVLELRFGLSGGKPLSAPEVAAKLGMTPDAVVAMEAAALAKMRG